MTDKALILHTVSDAQHCVNNDLHKGHLLFCTNSGVEVYMKEAHSVQCRCLSSFFTNKEVFQLMDRASADVDKLLDSLDTNVSPELNARYGFKINYFRCLYSYFGKFQYMGYLILSEAVKKISKLFTLTYIVFYDYRFNTFIDTDKPMAEIASLLFDNVVNTKAISYPNPVEAKSGMRLQDMVKRIRRKHLYIIGKLYTQAMAELKNRVLSKNKKTILVYDNLYEVDFLINNFGDYNVIFYKNESGVPVGFKAKEYVSGVSKDYYDFKDDIEGDIGQLFLSDLKSDFDKNIDKYLNTVLMLRDIQKKLAVSLGIWGLGPTNRIRAFVFEYLRSEGITILGAQHGCLYGDSYIPWHFDAELYRCTEFISYGFTEEDLRRLYPDKTQHASIVPLGKVKLPMIKKASKVIDILFPITNSISMLEGGMCRTLPHKMTEIQIDILNYLNGIKGLSIYVKPFINSNYDNCSVIPVLNKMKNLTVVYDMILLEFLEKYHPNAIIIEYPSQPLVEVLHMDMEIFLMNCELSPFENQALSELIKRVYFAYDTGELISMLEQYIRGTLPKKRDTTYYNHYVYKEGTKENIGKLINRLCEGYQVAL